MVTFTALPESDTVMVEIRIASESAAVAASDHAMEDQAFIDAVADWDEE